MPGAHPTGVWQVVRQDDNGNRFVVARGLSEARARELAAELEARGHKQLYSVELSEVVQPADDRVRQPDKPDKR